MRDVDNVVDEIEWLLKTYGVDSGSSLDGPGQQSFSALENVLDGFLSGF